jgi:hypothetical protein
VAGISLGHKESRHGCLGQDGGVCHYRHDFCMAGLELNQDVASTAFAFHGPMDSNKRNRSHNTADQAFAAAS